MASFAKSVSTDSPIERRSNLSEGVVGFQCVAPPELGQTVTLKFKLPGGKNHRESRQSGLVERVPKEGRMAICRTT
jgi:hypothetical protein